MPSVLPSPEEYEALTPRPGSPVWRAFNDVRALHTAGYATLLQVAHPTVGAGVHQYSSFTKDPWGRLLRTLDYVHGTIYGGPAMAGEIGRRVRQMHTTIRGERHDGVRYSAMEPDAFAWVHATLASGIAEGHKRFIEPMTAAELEAFWTQWLDVGRLIGVRTRDLPEDWAGFEEYFARTVEEKLVWTPAVPEVLATLAKPALPPIPWLPKPVFALLRGPAGLQLRLTTVGLLPPVLRDRLGLRFRRGEARAYRAIGAANRAAGPLIRGPLKEFGPSWVRWRSAALARGDVAAEHTRPETKPVAA